MQLADRTKKIKASPTLTIAAHAKQLMQEGKDLVNLSTGEPDFDTPFHIKEAAIKAIRDGQTKYTAVDGIPELKKAIIEKFHRDNQLEYSLKEVMASNGCKHVIYNALAAIINAGDEVIIPAPYWVSYPDMVLAVEGQPVFIETSIKQQFKITPDDLAQAITPKTKALIINSPSNPSGMMYAEKELIALAEVLLKHPDIYIISDDIYEHIQWTGMPFKNLINVCPELKSRTVIAHGVSKTYAMTGWRIGYAAGPSEWIQAMVTLQSQSTSNPNSIAQYAAIAALTGDQLCVKEMTRTYQRREKFVYENLSTISNIKIHPADGAFYQFFDISKVLEKKMLASDIDLAAYLLQEAGVVVVPGSAFGNPHCVRISYATSDALLEEAIKRLQKFL